MNASEQGKIGDSDSAALLKVLQPSDVFKRLAACKWEDVPDGPLIRFRDDGERIEFHTDMVCVQIRAHIFLMIEQLKVVKAYMDRR